MFRVGQKVVCVDASACRNLGDLMPVEGEIYTVRGLSEPDIDDTPYGVLLCEIRSGGTHRNGNERGWMPSRFRPVVERKTSIALFHAILNGAPVKEDTHV
jgi:hypothetical protein